MSALARAAERVAVLSRDYEPPDFAHVPGPDAAMFLCAVDHKTGYERPHSIGDDGPFEGSELMWLAALRSPENLTAERLRAVTAEEVAALFRVDDETVADPERRAGMWQDLAEGLLREYGGQAQAVLDAAGSRLLGPEGLVGRLHAFDAYSDPVGKKAFLFAKIAERRGWWSVRDPENWEVSADNVLMRLALRSGLVSPGPLDEVRSATRDALKALSAESGMSPPVLDDMLWELGRDEPDLLGRDAGNLAEPSRDPESAWY